MDHLAALSHYICILLPENGCHNVDSGLRLVRASMDQSLLRSTLVHARLRVVVCRDVGRLNVLSARTTLMSRIGRIALVLVPNLVIGLQGHLAT